MKKCLYQLMVMVVNLSFINLIKILENNIKVVYSLS